MSESDMDFVERVISEMSPMLGKSITMAREHHDRETFLHVARVARFLVETAPSDVRSELVPLVAAIAFLHDIVEDTDVELDDIFDEIDPVVAEVVGVLTRDPSDTYFDYIRMVRMHPVARMVKAADIGDHLTQEETLRPSLKARYLKAMKILDATAIPHSSTVH